MLRVFKDPQREYGMWQQWHPNLKARSLVSSKFDIGWLNVERVPKKSPPRYNEG